jgi:hypothetical protein
MKRAAILAILVLWAFSAASADSGEVSYESFQIVVDRNIFDPGRSPGRPARSEASEVQSQAPAQSDRVSLYGALIDGGTAVAFFSGTRDEYNRTARQGETIAGYRVIEIRTQSVELEKDGERIDLPVGAGLSRQWEGGWTITTESPVLNQGLEANRERNHEETRPRTETRNGSGPGNASPVSDLMQRMMERRKRAVEK